MTNPSHSSPRPLVGLMTRAMRAAPTARERSLRVGVLIGGRIVDERVMAQHGSITVGSREDCSLVVTGQGAPERLTLLERSAAGITLRYAPGTRGRVLLPSGPTELAAANARREGTLLALALGDDARGRVTIGDATILFQLVARAPSASRPELPLSVMPSLLDSIDWPVATLAAMSFLLHFGAIGTLYSDWADQVIPLEGDVRGLVTLPRTPPPTPTEVPPTEVSERDAQDPQTPAPKDDGHTARNNHGKEGKPRPSAPDHDATLAALDRLNTSTLGSIAGGGPSTAGVLRDVNVPTGDMTRFANGPEGVQSSELGLDLGRGTGPITGARRTLSDLGDGGSRTSTSETGRTAPPPAPKPQVSDSHSIPNGRIGGAERVLGGIRGRVRRCYETGLGANETMAGRVSYTITVSSTGSVSGVQTAGSGTLSPGVVSCVDSALRGLGFDPPEGGAGATIRGSYSFVNAQKP